MAQINETITYNSSVNATATNVGYLWEVTRIGGGGTPPFYSSSSTTGQNFTVTWLEQGDYEVKCTFTNECSTLSDTMFVNVDETGGGGVIPNPSSNFKVISYEKHDNDQLKINGDIAFELEMVNGVLKDKYANVTLGMDVEYVFDSFIVGSTLNLTGPFEQGRAYTIGKRIGRSPLNYYAPLYYLPQTIKFI